MQSIEQSSSPQARITDLYIITMLLIFPLFPGFSGYAEITVSKFFFLLAATGLWVAALVWTTLAHRQALPPHSPARGAVLLYLLISLLSLLCSPHRAESLLGAGRFDGLLSTLVYGMIFLGVSAFAKPKLFHAKAFALSISLCALVALLQLSGFNPLRLFPGDLNYYDAGVRYSGSFLGTIGNTNILDAVFCLSLPLFFSLYVCGLGAGFLLPVLLCVPILLKAGGDGGKVALCVFALAALPVLLTELSRVRRALRAAALCLAVAAVGMIVLPASADNVRLAFAPTPASLRLLAAALFPAVLSLLPVPRRFHPSARTLRRAFACVSAGLLLTGLAVLWFWPKDSGTIYEISQALHGNLDDRFGSSRIRIWRDCLALVPERPLLGGGPGTLALRLDITFSRFVPETGNTLSSFVDDAHNVYLGCLVNTGFAGLAALLLCYALSAIYAFKSKRLIYLPFALAALCCAAQEFFGLGLCLSEPLLWLFLGLLSTGRDAAMEAKT